MAHDPNFKAANLLVALVLVLHRAPVLQRLPLGRWPLLCLYISWCCLSDLDILIQSELRDLILLGGLAVYLAVLRSRIEPDTLKRPARNETPSSPLAHDRLALLAIVAVVVSLLRSTMDFRAIWLRDPGRGGRQNEAGIPRLFEWLQYQIQYALVMFFFYRLRTIGSKTRQEYARQLLAEAQHYQTYIYAVVVIVIVSSILNTALMRARNGEGMSAIVLLYTYAADLLLYGWALVFFYLTLIYMDLIACGFSREALLEHFAKF